MPLTTLTKRSVVAPNYLHVFPIHHIVYVYSSFKGVKAAGVWHPVSTVPFVADEPICLFRQLVISAFLILYAIRSLFSSLPTRGTSNLEPGTCAYTLYRDAGFRVAGRF